MFRILTFYDSSAATFGKLSCGVRVTIGGISSSQARPTPGVDIHALVHVPLPAGTAQSRQLRPLDRKSTRLNSSHEWISYAVFCLKKKKKTRKKASCKLTTRQLRRFSR